jgi:hypothetical protein
MASRCRVSSAAAFRDAARAIRDLGADELILVPTTTDVAELDRTLEALEGL